MKCPFCNKEDKSKVLDSRTSDKDGTKLRRRVCVCTNSFYTKEVVIKKKMGNMIIEVNKNSISAITTKSLNGDYLREKFKYADNFELIKAELYPQNHNIIDFRFRNKDYESNVRTFSYQQDIFLEDFFNIKNGKILFMWFEDNLVNITIEEY